MTGLTEPSEWTGTSSDPNDEQFGDVVETATLDSASEYDAVIVGEPYDGAVIGRRGAANGPGAIRSELASTKTHHLDTGPVGSIADLGDVDVSAGDSASVESIQETVREVTSQVYDADAFPVFLGGDNSLTFPNAVPLLDDHSLGVVSFDAHLDCREPHDGPTSGTPYRQLHEAGLDEFAVVGARHFETSTTYVKYVQDEDGLILTPEEVSADPSGAIARALAAMGGVDAIYVSVDLDVLDQSHAPGVSAPTPGGLSSRDLFELLSEVARNTRIAGLEVVECAPPLENGNRTVRTASRAIAHFLAEHGGEADE
jgi:formimidoylglutamase